MENKDLNQLKVVLAEKEENQQMARRTIRQGSRNDFQMVRQQCPA